MGSARAEAQVAAPHSRNERLAGESAAWSWTAHPARQRPLATALALAGIAAFAVAVTLTTSSAGWGIGAALLLVAALHRYFFPSRFRIDSEAVSAWYLLSRPSAPRNRVVRIERDRHGAFLAYRRQASWLDPYRGVHVLYGAHRREVEPRLAAWLAAPARATARAQAASPDEAC